MAPFHLAALVSGASNCVLAQCLVGLVTLEEVRAIVKVICNTCANSGAYSALITHTPLTLSPPNCRNPTSFSFLA